MPVPHRRPPGGFSARVAAFVEVVWLPGPRAFYGALLLMDGRGQPQEFVYNRVAAPSGFLWPDEKVRETGTVALCHSLFDACRREPELLVCREALGPLDFCRTEIAPSIPFAQVVVPNGGPPEWVWVNDPPSPGMPAFALAEEIRERGFAVEPFGRIRDGLREVYPDTPWSEATDDPPPSI